MKHTKFLIPLFATLTLLSATPACALSNDREKPIHISSDSADINEKSGLSIYRGNVIMIQGSTKLTGDIITIYSQDRQAHKVISQGEKQQAYFEEEQEAGKGRLKAWGNTIKYHIDNNKIALIKQAHLEQGGNTFKGERIEYDKQAKVVTARAGDSYSGKRVEMVIQPRQTKGLPQSRPR